MLCEHACVHLLLLVCESECVRPLATKNEVVIEDCLCRTLIHTTDDFFAFQLALSPVFLLEQYHISVRFFSRMKLQLRRQLEGKIPETNAVPRYHTHVHTHTHSSSVTLTIHIRHRPLPSPPFAPRIKSNTPRITW